MEESDVWIVVGSEFADALQGLGIGAPAPQFTASEYCLIKRATLENHLSTLILDTYFLPVDDISKVDDWITTRDKVRDYLGGLVVV